MDVAQVDGTGKAQFYGHSVLSKSKLQQLKRSFKVHTQDKQVIFMPTQDTHQALLHSNTFSSLERKQINQIYYFTQV